MKLAHILTPEELLQIKALKERRKVSTGDAPMLNAIYGRMTPGYEICSTCIETLGAEAKSLIAYAEKQIGCSILNYTGDEETESQTGNLLQIGTKEIVIVREYFGRKAKLTIELRSDFPECEQGKISVHMDESNGTAFVDIDNCRLPIKSVEYIEQEPGATIETTTTETSKIDVSEMSNAEIVAYVLEKTDVELSENADREELIDSAIDLLTNFVEESTKNIVAKNVQMNLNKVELHKNGLNATKSEIVIAYVKQETGIDLQQGLKRPALLKSAAEALERGK